MGKQIKNKLEKFGVQEAVAWLCYDSFAAYSHPSIRLESGGYYSNIDVDFQRHVLTVAHGDDWMTMMHVKQAEETVGTFMDVGAVPFSTAYGGKVTVSMEKLQSVAAIYAVIEKALHAQKGDCQFTRWVEALRSIGVPVRLVYHGRSGDFDHAYEVPEQYRDGARKWLDRVEVRDAKARELERKAAEMRAATAASEAA